MTAMQTRQPAGVPAGGQFAVTQHTEPDLTLEQLLDAYDGEDPFYDSDDPHHADLIQAEQAAAATTRIPTNLSDLDRYQLGDLRREVQARLDNARAAIAACEAARDHARDQDDPAAFVGPAQEEADALLEMDGALMDLHRVTEASTAGRMSSDDMTAEQRALVDATHRHAYDYGHAAAGGLVLADLDEAEEFASYVVHCLVRNDFDATSFELGRMLKDFDRERAGVLATRLAADSDQRDWVQQMASGSGASTERVRRGRAGALGSFARQLTDAGFYVERGTTTNGVTYRLTGGRPHPTPTVQDAA